MLQKITFLQLSDNLASINQSNVPTRAHDATVLNVLRPKSELFNNLTVIMDRHCGTTYLFINY